MRRVLIVDDEVLVRIGIKHSITWDQNGFELIGEASDGKEALEMIYIPKHSLGVMPDFCHLTPVYLRSL